MAWGEGDHFVIWTISSGVPSKYHCSSLPSGTALASCPMDETPVPSRYSWMDRPWMVPSCSNEGTPVASMCHRDIWLVVSYF